jgi:hypothetical protein
MSEPGDTVEPSGRPITSSFDLPELKVPGTAQPVPSIPSIESPPPTSVDAFTGPPTPPKDVSATDKARPSRTKLIAVIAAVVVVGAVIVGIVLVSSGGQTGFTSPAAANRALFAAARNARSFHYSGTVSGTVGGQTVTQTQTGDAGWSEGVQYQASNAGNSEVIVIGSVAYMKPDLLTLENSFGYTASQAAPYVNHWIKFIPSDAPFTSVAGDVTTQTTWVDSSQSHSVSPVSTIGGRSVQSVGYTVGGPSKVVQGEKTTGSESISFVATGPHLPIVEAAHLSGTIDQTPTTANGRVVFSKWGEIVHVVAPIGTIPYSSLPPPPTST